MNSIIRTTPYPPSLRSIQSYHCYQRQVAELKSVRELHNDLAWQLDDTQFLLRDLYAHRESGTDPLLEREIARLETLCASLEERLHHEAQRIAQLEAGVAAMRGELERIDGLPYV